MASNGAPPQRASPHTITSLRRWSIGNKDILPRKDYHFLRLVDYLD